MHYNRLKFSVIFIQIFIISVAFQGCDTQITEPPHSTYQANISESPITVEKHNPWRITSSGLHQPEKNRSMPNYNYLIPLNGIQYGTFVITNNSRKPENISFKVSNSDSEVITNSSTKTVSFDISNSGSPVIHIELLACHIFMPVMAKRLQTP